MQHQFGFPPKDKQRPFGFTSGHPPIPYRSIPKDKQFQFDLTPEDMQTQFSFGADDIDGRPANMRKLKFPLTVSDDYLHNRLNKIIHTPSATDTEPIIREISKSAEHNPLLTSISTANIKYKKSDVFLCIDSRYRMRGSNLSQGITVNIGSTANFTAQGILGLQYPLTNVTEIEVMNDIIIPLKYQASQYPLINTYQGEVTMTIDEVYSQGYIGPKNRFHFNFFSVPYSTGRLRLPIPYNSVFRLPQRVDIESKLTIRFGTPVADANFDDDYFVVSIEYTNPATLTVIQPIDQRTNGPLIPYFTSGVDFIAFDTFAPKNVDYDVNNPNSVVYAETFYPVTPVSQYTFTIPLDLTNPKIAQDPNRPTTATIFNGARRIRIPLRVQTNAREY
jgi:hypothetical protein